MLLPLLLSVALAPASAHTAAKGSVVVGTLVTPGKATFDVSVGECARPKGTPPDQPGTCGVFVTLRGGKKQRLEWAAPTGAIARTGDRVVAIGDDADSAVQVSWKAVRVAKNVEGIIVTQQSGGERIKRRHDVLLRAGGRALFALTANEPRGARTWSEMTPLDVDGVVGDEIVVLQASTPDEDAADQWEITVYGWRADAQKIVKLPANKQPSLYGAVVGMYGSAPEARAQQAQKCLRDFVVVDAKSAPLLPDGQFALVAMRTTQGAAQAALDDAIACDDGVGGAVKKLAQGIDVPDAPEAPAK